MNRQYDNVLFISMILLFHIEGFHACSSSGNSCPVLCDCSGHCNSRVDCTGRNLTAIPEGISEDVQYLELSMNNITSLPENAFSKYRKLEELRLVGNQLKEIPPSAFQGLDFLQSLNLRHNKIRTFPSTAFQYLSNLRELYLDANYIEHIPADAFLFCRNLRLLQLDANQLSSVPSEALEHLGSLHALDLSVNRISYIPDYAFINLTQLMELILHENKISFISDHAFEGLKTLSRLELPLNELNQIPAAFIALKDLQTLSLEGNSIKYIPDNSFIGNKYLTNLKLGRNPIRSFGTKAFRQLPHLKELIVSEAADMVDFPDLGGNVRLLIVQIDRSSISNIPDSFCDMVPNIESLDLHSNYIKNLPNLSGCAKIELLNIGENRIESLGNGLFSNNTELRDLILSNNKINSIQETSLSGLINLQYLDLSKNQISFIHEKAFTQLTNLDDLNLSENKFPHLPFDGLQNLRQLITFHNEELREPIPAKKLPKIKTLVLSYAYHCCDFLNPEDSSDLNLDEKSKWLGPNISIHKTENFTSRRQHLLFDFYSYKPIDYFIQPEGSDPSNTFVDNDYTEEEISVKSPIQCEPLPGPFLPCNDLFGWWTLRCGIWIVFMLAIFGNGTVLFVSISGKSSMNVPRFLICNLALADFCMGVYLGFLAIVDASTLGEFKTFAMQWQSSSGCLVAGFLGVVSSELSVFTLMIITIERHYVIANAMQFNKRLTLKSTGIIMMFGWIFCIGLASLPLFDISDYRKFAICLPFDISNKASLGFVCFIMIFNAASFLIIGGCYLHMYIYILRSSNARNSKDFRVAKRMAILVVTDFLCWAPIIFFSVFAAFGTTLVGLNEAKVLTIFVLPLNSCANPFLYAIFTKQFKRDCVKLCKRIEESSISRSFSNFNSLRVQLGISSTCRNSDLHSPFHEKRGSSRSNSDSFECSSGEVQNNNHDHLRHVTVPNSSYTCAIPEIEGCDAQTVKTKIASKKEHNQILSQCDCKCKGPRKEKTLSIGSNGTDAEIVIHLDKNGERVFSTDDETGGIDLALNSAESSDVEEVIPTCSDRLLPTVDKLCDKCGHIQSSPYCQQRCKFKLMNAPIDNQKQEDSTVLKKNVNISGRKSDKLQYNLLRLPKQHGCKDKNKHINEWRKSSHLSFLWRNSLNIDTGMPRYKSNSLVELTRNQNRFDEPSKRRSLSSKHEGILSVKNKKSKPGLDHDVYEFGNKLKDFPPEYATINFHDCERKEPDDLSLSKEIEHESSFFNKDTDSENEEESEETDVLLSKIATVTTESTQERDNNDKESGFSSGSQLLNC